MPAIYTKKALIERIKRHMVNNFPNDDFSVTDSEMLLYIDSAVASSMIGNVFGLSKIEGAMTVPEAYYVTYSLALTQDQITMGWYATLPQPPVSLPLGYSIDDVYFGSVADGKSQPVFPIEAKRVSYREFMPQIPGTRYSVENKKIKLLTSDGSSLQDQALFVTMVSTRTEDVNDTMNLPDDILESVFDMVVKKLAQRLGFPQDAVEDSLPAGNKGS